MKHAKKSSCQAWGSNSRAMEKPTTGIPPVPIEMWTEILLRIPAEDVGKFMVVCKAWYELIKSDSFVWSHVDHRTSRAISGLAVNTALACHESGKKYSNGIFYVPEGSETQFRRFRLNDNYSWECHNLVTVHERFESMEQQVLASCDGLLLLFDKEHHHSRLLVCNPATGSYRSLPTDVQHDGDWVWADWIPKFEWTMSRTTSIGRYKIFGIYKLGWKGRRCYVFELQGRGEGQTESKWKELQVPFSLGWHIDASTVKDGKVHWLATKWDSLLTCESKVLSVDILTEEFSTSVSVVMSTEHASYFELDGSFYCFTKQYNPAPEEFSLLALHNFDTMAWTEYRNIRSDFARHLSRAIRLLDMRHHNFLRSLLDFKFRSALACYANKVLPHANSLVWFD